MASNFKIIFIVTAIFAMTSCLPDPLELRTVDQLDPRIVVSSHVDRGTVYVLLTNSVSALDANDNTDVFELINKASIPDGVVRIQSNGVTYTLDAFGAAYSTSTMPLVAGQSYTLTAHSNKYGTVTATTIFQPMVMFNDVSVGVSVNGRDTLAEVSYKIQDQPGPNWYVITAEHTRPDAKVHLNPRVVTKAIDDTDFDGGMKEDTFKVPFGEVSPGDFVTVTLQNVSKDYFDYIKVREDTQFGIAAAVGEPLNYPTNINGGLGFFSLFVADSHRFAIEQ
jgi:hypothetical protein